MYHQRIDQKRCGARQLSFQRFVMAGVVALWCSGFSTQMRENVRCHVMSFEAAGSGCICVSLFSKERKLALFQKTEEKL